ncbi:MAG: hypothetical protein ACRCTE_06790 [Cellulosilyticaceae bacterium]
MKKISLKWQRVLVILGIVLLIGMTGNTNQNPNMFIEYVLRPLHIGNSVWNYAGMIILIGLYLLLKQFYKLTGEPTLNSGGRRVLMVLAVFFVAMPVKDQLVKNYRSMQSGIEALWLDREEVSIKIQTKEGESTYIEGGIRLENCSNEAVGPFNIELMVPRNVVDDVGKASIVVEKAYTLEPGEVKWMSINEVIEVEEQSGRAAFKAYSSTAKLSSCEIVLAQGSHRVVFQRTYTDELLDKAIPHGNAMEIMECTEEKNGLAAIIHNPSEAQMDMARTYLALETFKPKVFDETLLVIPYHVGSEIAVYELAYKGDQLVTGKRLAQYQITDDQQAVYLGLPVPCGIPVVKIVVRDGNQEAQYVVSYDGKGDRPQVETIYGK